MNGRHHTGEGLAARGLTVDLGGRRVLTGVDCALARSEMVGLIGPNGAGKTTLLRALAGLIAPTAGEVVLDGRPVRRMDRRRLAAQLAHLAQGERPHWPMAVRELVWLGRAPHRRAFGRVTADDRAAVARAMAATGTDALADRPASDLSAGETARVLLARALAGEPDWLLADEPVAGLDPYHQLDVMAKLHGLAASGRTVAAVLHDLTLAARFCDRVIVLTDGRIAASGPPREILTDARLRAVYGVRAVTGEQHGEPFVLPWARADLGTPC
ncbi:iron complex transport system ATP-binding protein [Limimonas halophila]|uniref:Iron complex transport system ATP-binding protein n=1 Tax=Limimonas halophila TaxID=1082479 RepID=A0A1G7M319_9PROT|nr:ABC transporter ATP-binding protein [Limimonas halophila]SDF56192.1 iron complex transport system ATP-binding protein [Limimonas halophila]